MSIMKYWHLSFSNYITGRCRYFAFFFLMISTGSHKYLSERQQSLINKASNGAVVCWLLDWGMETKKKKGCSMNPWDEAFDKNCDSH